MRHGLIFTHFLSLVNTRCTTAKKAGNTKEGIFLLIALKIALLSSLSPDGQILKNVEKFVYLSINNHNSLKEQYPVTTHAPNFDFWTGCHEIKRSEESKRTLKNPFASRLAGLLSFDFGKIWIFWRYFYCC